MRKFVFIINSLTGGGAERIMVRLLANSLHKLESSELHLILLDAEPAAYKVPAGIIVHQLDTRRSLIRGFFDLWKTIARINPQVCVSFLSRSNFLSIGVSRLRGIRCVASERVNTSSHHPHSVAGNVSRFLTKLIYPLADQMIAVSDGIATDLVANYAVKSDRVRVIPNPVDGEAVKQQAELTRDVDFQRPLIVGMGRLVRNKNFALLIDAFAKSEVGGTLVILGDGPLREELEEQVAKLDLSDRVRLPGFQDNPFGLIAAADCYVLPSNGEGFPNGLIEAMIVGTPVISTNCHSGPAEIVGDHPYREITGVEACKYGYLVPVNAPDAMADALRKVLLSEQRDALSAKSRAGAARYQLSATINRYWDVIEGRLESHADGGNREDAAL